MPVVRCVNRAGKADRGFADDGRSPGGANLRQAADRTRVGGSTAASGLEASHNSVFPKPGKYVLSRRIRNSPGFPVLTQSLQARWMKVGAVGDRDNARAVLPMVV